MILHLARHEAVRGIERGVYYFDLPDYPCISDLELKTAAAFILYEKSHGRETEIVCRDESILTAVKHAVVSPETLTPFILSRTTDYVYHATGLGGAKGILSSGELLSSVKVYGKTAEELAWEKRESPWSDPADYFEYVMFCNGDDMTGDYVVLSEKFPSQEDLEKGNFHAGVRFYFRSADIMRHPGYVFDGYHPAKVKDRVILSDYLFACIVPEQYKASLDQLVLPGLLPRVHYVPQKGIRLSEWNDKVMNVIKELQ